MTIRPDLIEGSKQREEAKRRQPHLAEVFDGAGDKEYLGDPETINRLLRAFVAKISDLRLQVVKGELTQAECVAAIQKRSGEIADIFSGKNPAYLSVQSWNGPDGLGKYLDSVCEGAGGPEEAIPAFILYFAAQASTTLNDYENDVINDDVAKFRFDVLLEDTSLALLGVSNVDTSDDDS